MKKILALLLILCMVPAFAFTGCGEEEPTTTEAIAIAGIKGPTSIGMIQLIDNQALNGEAYDDVNCEVTYTVADAADVVTGKLINNELQIAALPTNVASVLYNKTKGNIVFLAEHTQGILYLVGRQDITSIDQLAGKTVAISGSGNVPQFATDYILEQNGLTDSVTLNYFTDHASAAQVLLAGDADLAILPQPFVTQVTRKDESVKILLDLTDEWTSASNGESTLSMGCLVANKQFADAHPEFLAAFLEQYEASIQFVNENPSEAAELVAKHGIIEDPTITEQAIPYCNIMFKPAQEAKDEILAFLNVLYTFEPSSIGGTLPDDAFFYNPE